MSTHTPGPWTCAAAVECNAPNYFAVTIGKWGAPTIAKVFDSNDARLIAAAPELLDSLKAASRELRKYVRSDSPTLRCIANIIAKAERWRE